MFSFTDNEKEIFRVVLKKIPFRLFLRHFVENLIEDKTSVHDRIVWLDEIGWKWSKIELQRAVCVGNLPVLMFLVRQGTRMTDLAMYYAIIYGHLEIIKFLFSQNCPCSKGELLAQAIPHKNLEVIKLLIFHGASWSRGARHLAKYCGNKDFLALLYQNGLPRNGIDE